MKELTIIKQEIAQSKKRRGILKKVLGDHVSQRRILNNLLEVWFYRHIHPVDLSDGKYEFWQPGK